ncbi:MAG: polysaccharide deacetylase family protein [Spirochaetia bacterium]|nr:polysaccharide deacetylase family protein [Spirochaetia bacterium]
MKNPLRLFKKPWFWFIVVFALAGAAFNYIIETRTNNTEITVICYHSFFGSKKYPTDFSLDELREQLNVMRIRGYKFISFDDIENGIVTGDKNILVTIDDGNKSAFRAYEEVFKPEKIKPLFAIYTYAVGHNPFMTWDQVRTLSDDGCEIASHGHKHRPLTDNRLSVHPDHILEELLFSMKVLEKNLGKPVRVFVYPYGQSGRLTKKLVEMSGYEMAFNLSHGNVRVPMENNPDMYLLPRYMLTRISATKFLEKL